MLLPLVRSNHDLSVYCVLCLGYYLQSTTIPISHA